MKRLSSLKRLLPILGARRRRKADKEAKQVEIHNSRSSRHNRLPPELILFILEHIQGVDVLSFHFSCRRYALLMKPELKSSMTEDEKGELKQRMERDRYFKLAEAECPNVGSLVNLLCLRCRSSHPRSMFRDSEILQSPHVRWCNAARNVFRVCPHLMLTFDELKAVLVPRARALCPLSRIRCSLNPRCYSWPAPNYRGSTWIFSELFVLALLKSEGVSRRRNVSSMFISPGHKVHLLVLC
jgi:hypothetical protein